MGGGVHYYIPPFIVLPEKTPVNAVAATGLIVISDTGPLADETLTIGTTIFTFKVTRSGSGEITISIDPTTQGDNIVTAVTADLATVTATNSSGTVTIAAATKGVAGNSIALAESATNVAVSGAFLGTGAGTTAGVDGTTGVAGETCTDASCLYHCIATNTIADTNWRKISLGSAY